jgi:cytochrome c nitrite reductase small subunit
VRCHEELLTDSKLRAYNTVTHYNRMERKCWDCHRETPHGRVNSLSSAPWARVPLPGAVAPSWLKEIIETNN